MADESSKGIVVQDLVNGRGEWTNIQEVLRVALVDVIRAISRVDEKFVKELDGQEAGMRQVRNHLVRSDKANEKTLKALADQLGSLELSLNDFAKENDINQLKDQLLVFVHAKTKELATNTVVSAEQFDDLKQVLEGLPTKSDFEQVITHMKQVEGKNKKISHEIAETREQIGALSELVKGKPDKPHYDTLTKRLLFLDRKVKAYSDKNDKFGRRIYDIEETLLQMPNKETIEELGDHIVGLLQAARRDLGEQIGHATSKVDEFDSIINSKASKTEVTTEMYTLSKKIEDFSTSVSGKATKTDLDLFVRDLSVLETTSREWRERSLIMGKKIEELGKDLQQRVNSRELQAMEERVTKAIDSKVDELSVSTQDEFEMMKQVQADINTAKADKQEMKKIAKQMTGMNTRFRDWHDLIRQANTKASEVESKLADFATKQEHQTLQKVLTANTTKMKGLGEDHGNLKKKIITIKEEMMSLPVQKDLDELQESMTLKIAAESKSLLAETSSLKESLTKVVEETLPNEYASKENLNTSKELMIREAKSMILSTNESVSSVEKKLALTNSELMDELAKKVELEKFDHLQKTVNSQAASTAQNCSEQLREGQLRMDRIESQLDSKSDKIDFDMYSRDLSSLEQVSQLFSQQTSSRLESLDSKMVSLAESLNDQVEVSKKLHMDFLQKPDRDDIKLLILAELNAKTKGLEQNSQAQMKKISELSTRLDIQQLVTSDVQSTWQDDHDELRSEVKKMCEEINSKHKQLVRELKDDTIKTMETVLEGIHNHQKETNSQMLEFEQQMRHRFEDANSQINEQHNHEVAARIENETSLAENIRKLQIHIVQMDEAHGAIKDKLKHSVDVNGDVQQKLDIFARQVNTKLVDLSNTRVTLEQDVNSQVISLQKKFTDVSRDIVEAVDGKLSRCITRSEMDQEMESLRKVVSLKSKMSFNSKQSMQMQGSARVGRSNLEDDHANAEEDEGKDYGEKTKSKEQQRILELESKVLELSHKPPTSIFSNKSEIGGLVRMWGDDYAAKEKHLSRHLKRPALKTADSDGSGIVSLLDKSAQRILSIRTQGAERAKRDKPQDDSAS